VRPARQPVEHVPGLGSVGRLAEHDAVHVHLGVAGQHGPALDRPRLAQGIQEHDLARIAVRELLDVRRPDRELDPELLENGLPLRRGRREN